MSNAMHRSKLTLIVLLISATVLVGCSDEPSSDEMHKLVDEHVAKQLKAHSVKGFKGFIDFRKQGCVKTKDKEGYFDCYYNFTFPPMPSQPQRTFNGKGQFHRTAKGLVFQEISAMPDDRPFDPDRGKW
ncbi:MAG: hypothetical protein WCJ64_26390 [Rhodospirillaceae bacterium]